jgi:glyoxylase-like metal-dependent hydrolase (beta-lactamase superfamily II)
MTERSERWRVGDATITAIVETQTDAIPPQLFFPGASAEDIVAHEWLIPDHAHSDGTIAFRVQAFVIELGGWTILVDPCVGNHKLRALPFWHDQEWPWFERFLEAGFDPDHVDVVLHTHLHADHVGWDTRLVDGAWEPTFQSARYVYAARELDHWRRDEHRQTEDVYGDSVEPIIEAGLADIVADDVELGGGLRLVPTPGHTPGHVSVEVDGGDAHAVITGDLLHHPVQLARPDLAEVADWDIEMARETRASFFAHHGERRSLVFVTHFASPAVGRFVGDGERWRWHPEPGELLGVGHA